MSMQTQSPQRNCVDTPSLNPWFEELIAKIRAHQVMIETNTAPTELKEMYTQIATGNLLNLMSDSRALSFRYFIEQLIKDYISEIKEPSIKPLSLAFNLSNTRISVWAIIEDNDEETEDKLILAEAKVNAKYRSEGFYLDTMILEKSDNYPIPNHYQKVL
jgi:hypothetical protein